MIAKLRARHRAIWGALAVVAPAVLIGALSVRRGEVPRQDVPESLLDEVPGVQGTQLVAGEAQAGLRWLQDPTSGQWILEVGAAESGSTGLGDAVLLYWTATPTDSMLGWLSFKSMKSPTDLVDLSLPDDAVLLGAQAQQDVSRFPARDALQAGGGVLIWYDLAHSAIVWLHFGPEPAR